MECPRCNNEVSEHDKVCPHCKKVLLLECPICHKLSRTPLCPECGFVIISKCHNCGQINQTIKGICKKCGFSTYKSISMNEAETDEFACLAITFPNLEELRPALKNKQVFNKFYKKLKAFIFNYGKQQDNRVQLIENNFIIKYYKEFSMSSSVNKAVKSAIELMNKVAEISYKFKKSKGIKMACKMTILKRTLENDNESFNTGLNIKLINTDTKKEDYADGLQLITDQYINSIISRQYKLEMIYSSQVNDELLEFYEFPIKEQLTPIVDDEPKDKQNILTKPKELPKITDLTEEKAEIDLYSNKAIDIQTKCEFLSLQGIDVPGKIKEFLSEKNVFITLKSKPRLGLSSATIMQAISSVNPKILHVVCSEGFVYDPYACFKELIAYYLGFDTKLANLDVNTQNKLNTFDKDEFLYKLLIHKPLENIEPQDALKQYMEIFYAFIESQKGSVIFIENFDLIDETSLEIFISMVENFESMGISFVVTVPDTYLAHKEINELLYLDAYKEITITKTDFERLVETIPEDISEIKDSFYFQKIKDQFLGGTLYFQHAMQYLRDTNVFISHENKLLINSEKTIIFPSSLEQLLVKRFESLEENECYILAYASFLGNNMVMGILNDLGIEKLGDAIRSLCDKKFITVNNYIIEVQNYRLLQGCIKDFLAEDVIKLLTKNIFEKLHAKTIAVIKSLGLITESQMTIYELSEYALSHGDFNAYLRNCKRFLNLIEGIPKKNLLDEVKDAKDTIYRTLSKYLNKYPSHKIYAISKVIFDECMRRKNDLMIMNTSSLMLDSALMGENYILAQQSLHHVLIRMLNPALAEAAGGNVKSKYFFYSCINVKILFHAGKFQQCIEVLDKIIASINQELFIQLGQSNVSKDAFVNYFMTILVYGALARVIVCDTTLNKFFDKINYMFSQDIPGKKAILQLQQLLHNEEFEFNENEIEQDNISQIVGTFIAAWKKFDGDYNTFAQNIYKVKLMARAMKESFWSLLCDLLIGYCYQKLDSDIKANVIFSDVASISQKSGMGFLSILANWFIANLKYDLHEYDKAAKLIGDNIVVITRTNTDDKLISILSYILQINIIVAQNALDTDIEPILYKINYGCERYNLKYLESMLIDYEDYINRYKEAVEAKKAAAEAAANKTPDDSQSEPQAAAEVQPAESNQQESENNTTEA